MISGRASRDTALARTGQRPARIGFRGIGTAAQPRDGWRNSVPAFRSWRSRGQESVIEFRWAEVVDQNAAKLAAEDGERECRSYIATVFNPRSMSPERGNKTIPIAVLKHSARRHRSCVAPRREPGGKSQGWPSYKRSSPASNWRLMKQSQRKHAKKKKKIGVPWMS